MLAATSDSPLFAVDRNGKIGDWNAAAERLTGIPRQRAVGRPCWEVLRAVDPVAKVVCSATCYPRRAAQAGQPVDCGEVWIGSCHTFISSVLVTSGSEAQLLHTLAPLSGGSVHRGETTLTARQLEVLALLADGMRVREIARRLSLAEITVRNHVRAIIAELDVHSQLEAVAEARGRGLL